MNQHTVIENDLESEFYKCASSTSITNKCISIKRKKLELLVFIR